MRRLLPLPGLVLALLATSGRAQSVPTGRLDRFVAHAMSVTRVPGVAIVVVRGDSIIHRRGYGLRTVGRPEPVDERTMFAIGSATKAFTATIAAMLVDQGRLGWDDRVVDRLPGFAMMDPWSTREITVRDLLAHRSGLPRCDVWYDARLTRAEVVRRIRHCPPAAGFRSGFGYHNLMYLAAGELTAAAAGLPWDRLVTQWLLEPLGMASSNTSIEANRNRTDLATPHAIVDGAVRPVPWRNLDAVGPAGSINSNLLDMTRWLQFQLGNGALGERRLVGAAAMAETRVPQIPIRADLFPQWADSPFLGYGLGWFVWSHRGLKVVEHSGGIDGMSADVAFLPDRRLGIVVLANLTESTLPAAIVNWLLDLEAGVEPRDWAVTLEDAARGEAASAVAAQEAFGAARVSGTAPSLPLERYAGIYRDSLYGEIRIERDGRELVIGSPDWEDRLRLSHWHYDVFRAVWPRYRLFGATSMVGFELAANGTVAAVRIDGLGTYRR